MGTATGNFSKVYERVRGKPKNKDEKDVVFLHIGPHYCHRKFAESINAKFIKLHRFGNFILRYKGLFFPDNKIYFAEHAVTLIPTLEKKRKNEKVKIIALAADYTFLDYIADKKTLTFLEEIIDSNLIKRKFIKTAWLIDYNFNWKYIRKHINLVDGIIAVSKMVKERISEYYDGEIKIVYPFINKNLHQKLEKISPNLSSNNILTIGYARPYKRIDVLIDAFIIAKREVKDLKLTIVGRGWPKKYERIKGIKVIGFKENLLPLFERSSLYIQSSLADPFPVSVLEAMASGIPAIVTKGVGSKEIIEKINSWMVREVEPQDLAEGIVKYFSLSEKERMKISELCRKYARKFNEEDMVREFKKKFFDILS